MKQKFSAGETGSFCYWNKKFLLVEQPDRTDNRGDSCSRWSGRILSCMLRNRDIGDAGNKFVDFK